MSLFCTAVGENDDYEKVKHFIKVKIEVSTGS